jgi:leucyl aminopeptidase
MKTSFSASIPSESSSFILFLDESLNFDAIQSLKDLELGVDTFKSYCKEYDFTGKKDDHAYFTLPLKSGKLAHFHLKGSEGCTDCVDCHGNCQKCELLWQEVGANLLSCSSHCKAKDHVVDLSGLSSCEACCSKNQAAHVAYGALLKSWSFTTYFTDEKKKREKFESLTILTSDPKKSEEILTPLKSIYDAVITTKRLVSEPANVIYPETLANEAKMLSKLGVEVEILDKHKMKELGMGAILGVAQGSANDPYLVVLKWMNGKKDDAPYAFVGKGVTFDTGGIDIKPRANMDEMKTDMAGSAVVLGVIKALALLKTPVNAIGVMGLVENMPSGTAQRPGDIVTTMSGKTVEILDTDAEGRLVLADALWYTQDRFKPKAMIDLATLTGAVVVALGIEHAGLLSDTQELAEKLKNSAKKTGEKIWQLPLDEAYDKTLKSEIADIKNLGSDGAGTITAAHFLKRFTNQTPWAHLDIAGTAWIKKDKKLSTKGATGFGVRLLVDYVLSELKG